ncbi:Mitochondrial inner membrane protein OXA1-like [Nymphaea thermarum]|nr:Mitochondrial inner membrane protein OXA1-like [Nymphaea thermarum]
MTPRNRTTIEAAVASRRHRFFAWQGPRSPFALPAKNPSSLYSPASPAAAGGGGRRISSSFSLLIRTHHLSASRPSTTSALYHHHHHDDPTTSYPPPQSRPIFRPPRHLIPDRETLAVSSWLKPRRPYGVLLPLGAVSAPRHYSSSTIGEETDKIEYMNDVAEVLTEKAVEAVVQTPGVDEVAVAAADSFSPVAALQYLMDAVHHYTRLNW